MDDKYERMRVVGKGAYGTCWLCKRKDDPNGEKVIVKSIQMNGLTEKEQSDIKGEANMLRRMQHPMIIGYHEYFAHENSFEIVMQYAEGGTMEKMLQDRKGVHIEEKIVLNYFTQILLGLEYIHSLSIVHRDLKTQNILLNRKKTIVKLSDFGISKELKTKGMASTLIGTPNYLSPEICEGRDYNQQSDLWALGCVLYEMFMLRRAFDGANLNAIVMKITKQRYEPLGNHVSYESQQITTRLLSALETSRPAIKELLTCPLLLPYALSVVLDIGRVVPYERKKAPVSSAASYRARTGNFSAASTTVIGDSGLQAFSSNARSTASTSYSTTKSSYSTATTFVSTVRKS